MLSVFLVLARLGVLHLPVQPRQARVLRLADGRGGVVGGDLESDAFVEAFGTEDARLGVQSFLEHGPGKAKFSGR